MTRVERIGDLGRQVIDNFSWPLLILSAVGVWSLWRRHVRGRARIGAVGMDDCLGRRPPRQPVFAGVDPFHVRYSSEFLGRINLATVPLIAISAARGAASGWEAETSVALKRPFKLSPPSSVCGRCSWR
jgi:hypothetical protein